MGVSSILSETSSEGVPVCLSGNIRALITRIGLGVYSTSNYNKEPPKPYSNY